MDVTDMQYRLKLSEIPFFGFVNPSLAKKMVNAFTIEKYPRGEPLLNYSDTVPGFYIIAEGEVDVLSKNQDILITTLVEGNSFGEMSLLENETSSASLIPKTDCVVLLCKKELFQELLKEDFVFSAAFYKGAALILSNRLRNTNLMVEKEIEKGRTVIKNMTHEGGVLEKLGHTQYSLNDTGETMIAKLTGILPKLDQIKGHSDGVPQAAATMIDDLKKEIKNILLIDSQSFDIISQQMDQINQHILNVQRILKGLEIDTVKGDANIFQVERKRSEEDEDAITFF